jgi:hypothetical protein
LSVSMTARELVIVSKRRIARGREAIPSLQSAPEKACIHTYEMECKIENSLPLPNFISGIACMEDNV